MNTYKEKEKERNVNNIFFDPHQTFQTMTHTSPVKNLTHATHTTAQPTSHTYPGYQHHPCHLADSPKYNQAEKLS